jgi:heme-based aerotactic transducer
MSVFEAVPGAAASSPGERPEGEDAMTARSLTELFGIDDQNLAQRRELTGLGDTEREIIAQLQSWASEVAPDLVRDFYDHQLGFAPTRDFFEKIATARGVSVPVLRARLEEHQKSYFLDIFRFAESGWGLDYYERRLAIGWAHDHIDLPLKWYLAHYAQYEHLVRRHLAEHFADPSFVARAEEAIFRVLNYDMQAVADAYLLSVFESMGLELASIEPEPGRDRTERVGEMKQRFRGAIHEILRIAPAMSQASGELSGAAGRMSESAMATLAHADTTSAAVRGIQAHLRALAQELQSHRQVITEAATGTSGAPESAARDTTELATAGESIAQVVSAVARSAHDTHTVADRLRGLGDTLADMSGDLHRAAATLSSSRSQKADR